MRPKKIILIIIDSLRQDHLGCYGYKRNTSPNIDDLAKKSFLFKHAFSPSSLTIPSICSILTSKYPGNHSIGFDPKGKLDPNIDITLASILSKNNYKTAAFVSSKDLRKDTNLNAGFELYDDETGFDLNGRRDCLTTNLQVIKWLEENYDQNFFLFVHYFDVHGPYVTQEHYKNEFVNDGFYGEPEYVQDTFDINPTFDSIPGYQILNPVRNESTNLLDHEKDVRYYKAQYDGCIRHLDDNLGELIKKLQELEIYDDNLIIVTSDHGEAHGENNIFFYHGLTVTLDQISVPLILKPHNDKGIKNRLINIPVSTIDIMPTVLSLCDHDYSSIRIEGHSLTKILEDEEDPLLKDRTLVSENEGQFALIKPDGLMELKKKDDPVSSYYPHMPALIDSLNGKKFYWDSGNEYTLTIPFDQYQRYKIIADIINKFRKDKKIFKILDVGAGFEKTLKKFLPDDDIYFFDKDYPPELKTRAKFITGDITKVDLNDSYDFVISIDAYEHISPISREGFINKLIHLSKIATIVAAPFDTPGVHENEIFANEAYKLSHGIEYKWLHEHIHNGLPSLPFTLELIEKSGFNYTVIPNGYLPRWFEMISIYFLTEGMPELSKSMEELYEFYNKNFYSYDNVNPAYRQVIVISKVDIIPDLSDIYAKNSEIIEDFSIKSEILQSFYKKIKELCSNFKYGELIEKRAQVVERDAQIKDLDTQIRELKCTLETKNAQITELTSTLQSMQQSILWRLLMKYDQLMCSLLPHGTYRRKYYDAVLFWIRSLVNKEKNLEKENKAIISLYTRNKIKIIDIICFPIINWDFRYQRPQQLLSRFAKNGYRVFYLTVDPSPLKRAYNVNEIERNVLELKLSTSSKFNIHTDVPDKEQIDSFMDSFNDVKRDFNIDKALNFVEFPNWEPIVTKLKEIHDWKIIYDCMDEHTGFSTANTSLAAEEVKLFKESALVVVTSSHLLKKAQTYRKDVIFVPNAGDFEHFNKLTENDLLVNIKKPIIGYFGAIAEWFDNDLIEFVASNKKNWNFVLVGHTFGSNIKKLKTFKNVHFMGEISYAELPKYLYWFDVCIIPFKLTPLIEATHPVKFYEYLSSGKPVVSSKLPELLPFQELCYIAETREEFLEKIEIALEENDMNIRNKRIEFVKNNTWDARYQMLISHIEQRLKVR